MRYHLAGMAAGACFLVTVGSGSAAELKYNTFEPPRAIGTREVMEFAKRLEEETKGSLKMRVFAGGQLLKGPATLKGIGDGVVDAGFIVPSLVQGQLKATNVIPDLLPYVENNFVAAAASVQTAVVDCQECLEEHKAAKVVWLGGHGPSPWYLMCSGKIGGVADLRGKRTRVTGASATRMIQAIGGVAVQLPPTEIAPALQGGQIDCAFGNLGWFEDYSLYTIVKTVVDYPIGVYGGLGIYTFNRDVFARFSVEEKKALLKLVPHYVVQGSQVWSDHAQAARNKAVAGGVVFWQPDAEFKARMDTFRKEEVTNLAEDMKKRGAPNPEKLIKLHLGNVDKWSKKMGALGGNADRLIAELRREIYAKVLQ